MSVLERLEEALHRTKEKIVHAARKKRHLEGFLEDFDARIDGTSEAAVYGTHIILYIVGIYIAYCIHLCRGSTLVD